MASGTAKTDRRDSSSSEARDEAQEAARSDTLRKLAALGLLAYALIHLLIGWLAVQLAWRLPGPAQGGGKSTDQSGALTLLARSAVGDVMLWVIAVGMAGLAVWQAVEVLRHHRHLPDPGRERWWALLQLVKTVGTGLIYGYLAYSAARTALGHGKGRGKEEHQVGGVLGWPGGKEIVVGIALITAGIGVYLAIKGLRSGFLDEIDLDGVAEGVRALVHRVSQVGFFLKGTALVLVGVIVSWAAITFDPKQADGMDGAMRTIERAPYGQWMLTVIAAGLAAYAVYCVTRARHPVG
jgi:uncharacterized membrane protein YhaH (DUF805 family)